MKFLFDIGNTRCKFAVWNNDTIGPHFSCGSKEADDIDLSPLVSFKPDSVWVSSVRSKPFNDVFAGKIEEYFSVRPKFARTMKSVCKITTVYNPGLGVDRFLALIAAWHEFQSACVVVDCGTAVTIDALDFSGVHLGGLIMPGLSMLAESLERGADGLSLPDIGQHDALFADDTCDAIVSGCRHMWSRGIIATVEQMGQRIDTSLVVVTGGDGRELDWPQSEYRDILVLEGLAFFSHEADMDKTLF